MTRAAEVFSVNDRVSNSVYGIGTISQVNTQYTTIVFDEHGTKKFLTSMVKLEHSSTPAPAKPVRAKKPKVAKVAKTAKPAKSAK
jgi:hypothetical protein